MAAIAVMAPSMEGRAIARPNYSSFQHLVRLIRVLLQWRAEQLPGQTARFTAMPTLTQVLQWRAEQLPGQTPVDWQLARRVATDLQWRAEQLPGQTGSAPDRTARTQPPFNGGPSNCPAKPPHCHPGPPGTTFNGGPSNCPAKRHVVHTLRVARARTSFNGGPSNCPAKPDSGPQRAAGRADTFNGGPSNCPAKRVGPNRNVGRWAVPSMEGRAIARPNQGPLTSRELALMLGDLHRWMRQIGHDGRLFKSASDPVEVHSMAQRLGSEERVRVDEMARAGVDVDEMARRLGRHRSTLHRELKRGGGRCGYDAEAARAAADLRARRPKTPKLAGDPVLAAAVGGLLAFRMSPHAISEQLRLEGHGNCAETVYAACYDHSGARGLPEGSWRLLPRRCREA